MVELHAIEGKFLPLHRLACLLTRCRACSTAERTATNIVIAPIARAHHAAPHTPAPCSPLALLLLLPMLMLPTPHARAPHSSRSCSPLLTLVLPTPHAHAPHSSLTLPALSAPAPCSSRSCSSRSCSSRSCSLRSQLPFRLWHCSRTFPSTYMAPLTPPISNVTVPLSLY